MHSGVELGFEMSNMNPRIQTVLIFRFKRLLSPPNIFSNVLSAHTCCNCAGPLWPYRSPVWIVRDYQPVPKWSWTGPSRKSSSQQVLLIMFQSDPFCVHQLSPGASRDGSLLQSCLIDQQLCFFVIVVRIEYMILQRVQAADLQCRKLRKLFLGSKGSGLLGHRINTAIRKILLFRGL